MKSGGWLLLVLSFVSAPGQGAELPEPVIPAGVGVNIHFVTGHGSDLDRIAAAGFKFVRMDFQWSDTERQKGEFTWKGYEELLKNLDDRGLRALFILDYSNPLYEETVTSPHPITQALHRTTASPQHPESVAAFARWAGAAAKHFRGRHVIWEIWNEPNGHFWSPKPDATQYCALAVSACQAVRAGDPKATVVGPASSGFPWDFLETVLKSGVLDCLDAVSVHPYRDRRNPPETAATDYEKLRRLIDRYAPAGKAGLPILSGEWGYSTHSKGVTLETQGAFAARQQLANLLAGVPLSIWYDWKNDGPDANENEHNFGTVLPDLSPKPAYVAIQTLTRELGGYRVVRRVPLANPKDYLLLCVNGAGEQKLAAWTLDDPHLASVELPNSPDQITAVNVSGGKIDLQQRAGRLELELGPGPLYAGIGKRAVPGK